MSRFRSMHEGEDEGNTIDISPLIDCVFILLIFFIVTTTFVEETGVDVDRPQAASSVQLEKNSIMIAVTDNGQVVYGGREIGVAGVQPIIKRMLQKEQMPVIVQTDRTVPASLLVQVIDEAKLGGAETVSIATRRQSG